MESEMTHSRSAMDMTRMTSPEVAAAIANGATTAIVVLGAQEQHGDHLPLATDTLWGERLAELLANRLGDALIAPPVSVGFSPEHMNFAGTISLRPETLAAVLEDYVASLERHGFQRIVVLPSHGGNFAPLADALPALRQRHPNIPIVAYTDLIGLVEAAAEVAAGFGVTPDEAGAHAGEWETSMMLVVEPAAVHHERGTAGYMGSLAPVFDQINRDGMESVTPNGVLGDPAKATAEHGSAYLERIADLLAGYIRGESD
ncbi:MAG: creatininase family protein [Thermomicrobiales bacterium]|nr:creatininase family protein [Thermomicrobiales bacterium]